MKSLCLNKLTFLFAGVGWVLTNVFFLPFFPWTLGISRPWFILHGYIPYRDFTWMRNPLDIYLLSIWYKIFGATPQSYQFFILILYLLALFLIYYIAFHLLSPKRPLIYFFYIIFLFPLFINTEVGEIAMGVLTLCTLIAMIIYLRSHRLLILFLAGVFCGFMYLTKQSSAFISITLSLTIFVDSYIQKESLFVKIKKLAVYFSGISIPIGTLMLYFAYKNALNDYLYYTIFFLLGPALKYAYNFSKGNGGLIAAGYVSLLVPFILFWKDLKLKPQQVVLFVPLILASLFSLPPSYLSYRAFPSFPLVSVIAGYTLSLVLIRKIAKSRKLIVLISFILFFGFTNRFIAEYIQFVSDNGFHFEQYILDYSSDEKNVAKWIKENTGRNEKIQNFGNDIIYVLSNRLPKHKYIEPFYYVFAPYEKTSQLFMAYPPRIVVYDETTPKSPFGIDDLPFIQYMKKVYTKKVQFGNLLIYQLEKK